MKLLNVPHYAQPTVNDCQGTCAAMVLDYFSRTFDEGSAQRIRELMTEFAFGFTSPPEEPPPAVTGLAAMGIADRGHQVHFYSTNPKLVGTEGYRFLKEQRWGWCEDKISRYATHVESIGAKIHRVVGLTVQSRRITEQEVQSATAHHNPIVMLVHDGFLKGVEQSVNHVYVVTGIDDTTVRVQDPAGLEPHYSFDRTKFFEANRQDGTDCDAYVVTEKENCIG